MNSPGKTIPRSILLSLGTIAVLYVAMNLSVVGVVPWREFASPSKVHATDDKVENRGQDAERGPSPAEQERQRKARFVVSIFMERIYGGGVARAFTLLILWTTFASCFALLLGYSRIPYAAARDGCFFKMFKRLHPTGNFPHVSLLVIGLVSIVCCVLPLDLVIDALVSSRILVQFIGQIVAVALLRRREPQAARPYRIWLYPLPSLVALVGWTFVFVTSDPMVIGFGLAMPVAGVILFFGWSWRTGRWPFA